MTGPRSRALAAHLDVRALRAAKTVAQVLATAGAKAIILTGSHARREAGAESDLDVVAIGRGPAYRLQRSGGYLIAVSWTSAAAVRRAFRDPSRVGAAIPGWREALILHDPGNIAAALQREAKNWTWDRIAADCDAWVAEEVTGYAEEVHKLVHSMASGERWAAAVQRSVLALRLGPIMAVRHRMLYGSENRLWDSVADVMGTRWREAQAVALGDDGQGFEPGCAAALELYALAAADAWPLLDRRQRAVVAHACKMAGFTPR